LATHFKANCQTGQASQTCLKKQKHPASEVNQMATGKRSQDRQADRGLVAAALGGNYQETD
jgi:hypothetical protein